MRQYIEQRARPIRRTGSAADLATVGRACVPRLAVSAEQPDRIRCHAVRAHPVSARPSAHWQRHDVLRLRHRLIGIQCNHRLLCTIEAFAGGADAGVVFACPIEQLRDRAE